MSRQFRNTTLPETTGITAKVMCISSRDCLAFVCRPPFDSVVRLHFTPAHKSKKRKMSIRRFDKCSNCSLIVQYGKTAGDNLLNKKAPQEDSNLQPSG